MNACMVKMLKMNILAGWSRKWPVWLMEMIQKPKMTKVVVVLCIAFTIGWGVRVGLPYLQSFKTEADMNDRRKHVATLLLQVYEYARTNSEIYPSNLSLITLNDNNIYITKYIYIAPTHAQTDKIREQNVVIAEKETSFPGKPRYFVGLEGNWVILKSQSDYRRLLKEYGYYDNMKTQRQP
jgi:hypothetical protein